jgi:hypothetical protein
MATPQETPAQKADREKKEAEAKQKAEQQERERQDRSRNAAGSVVSPGAASTYNMAGGSQGQVPLVDPRGDRFFTSDEIKSMAGDIQPGEFGWLKLDENGTPVGSVDRESPFLAGEATETYARVIGASTHKYDEIVTPSGAPVTKFMNPDPVLWDEGMLARNPIPEETERSKQFRAPPGAPVVNQPVSYGN